jgi:hypothetical protein
MTYSLHAFRYDDFNGHSYPLGSVATFEEAKRLAHHHTEYRGGKYGVAVYGPADGEEIPEVLYYSPSRFNGEKPTHNLRISYEEILGGRLLHAVEDGTQDAIDDCVLSARIFAAQLAKKEAEQ